jgi:uncharacterized protein (DUF1778 family)
VRSHGAEQEPASAERTGLINIRIKPADKALIDQAAATQGKKRSEFMLDAARRAAEEALLDSTLLRVDRQTYGRFVELLDKPPEPNEALHKLLQQKAPWEA